MDDFGCLVGLGILALCIGGCSLLMDRGIAERNIASNGSWNCGTKHCFCNSRSHTNGATGR